MTENTIEITKALLVSVDTNDFDNERSLEELKELSKTTTLPDRPDEKAVQDLAMRIKQAILDAA